MENNYNEWNPDGMPEMTRDDINRAETVNESESAAENMGTMDGAQESYEAQNTYESQSSYDTHNTYESQSSYEAQNTYESQNGHDTQNTYESQNAYETQNTYEAQNTAEAGETQVLNEAPNPYQQYHNQNRSAYTAQSGYNSQNQAGGTQTGYTQSQMYGTQASGYGSQGRSYGPIEYNQQGSPYGQQNQYGTQNTASQAYGTQNGVNQSYGTQNNAGQTYGTQSNASQPYGTANSANQAYGTQNNAGQPYGTANSTNQTHGAQNNAGQPYGTQANPNQAYGVYGRQGAQSVYGGGVNYQQESGKTKKAKKEKKEKQKGGFGALIGKTVAVALVFGLVASLVFTGVNYGLGKAMGTTSASSDNGLSTNTVSTVSTSGEATDLVDVSSIVDAVMPSIVAITNISTVTTNSMFGTYSYESQSLGSGIIIAKDDDYLYICTNNHVVAGAETLTVQFVDDSTVSAEITGTDASDDLAVIQVALSSIESDTLSAITVAQVDDSGDLSVGEATIAIGNSLGYGQSVTTGVISALGRTISVTDETTGETTVCTNLIQTDAAINNGNSGGALLNSSGAVIGINSAKYSDTGVEGMGYAIPMSDAWSIIQALIAGEDIPQSAYLGISGQTVSSDVSSVYGVPEGVLVVEVLEGTAAEKAGISSGDIITKLEGEAVASMDELKTLLAGYKEGDVVTITVARQSTGYEETDVTVTLGSSTSGD